MLIPYHINVLGVCFVFHLVVTVISDISYTKGNYSTNEVTEISLIPTLLLNKEGTTTNTGTRTTPVVEGTSSIRNILTAGLIDGTATKSTTANEVPATSESKIRTEGNATKQSIETTIPTEKRATTFSLSSLLGIIENSTTTFSVKGTATKPNVSSTLDVEGTMTKPSVSTTFSVKGTATRSNVSSTLDTEETVSKPSVSTTFGAKGTATKPNVSSTLDVEGTVTKPSVATTFGVKETATVASSKVNNGGTTANSSESTTIDIDDTYTILTESIKDFTKHIGTTTIPPLSATDTPSTSGIKPTLTISRTRRPLRINKKTLAFRRFGPIYIKLLEKNFKSTFNSKVKTIKFTELPSVPDAIFGTITFKKNASLLLSPSFVIKKMVSFHGGGAVYTFKVPVVKYDLHYEAHVGSEHMDGRVHSVFKDLEMNASLFVDKRNDGSCDYTEYLMVNYVNQNFRTKLVKSVFYTRHAFRSAKLISKVMQIINTFIVSEESFTLINTALIIKDSLNTNSESSRNTMNHELCDLL